MHGRVKSSQTLPTPSERDALSSRIEAYRSANQNILQWHHDKIYSSEAVATSSNLIHQNGDHYTLWHYRKNVLLQRTESIQEEFNQEMKLVQQVLQSFPKSYCVWHHRLWLVTEFAALRQLVVDWEREIKLCSMALSMDARNFHCWNYRRQIVHFSQQDPHTNTATFTLDKIRQHFSNYSAWHSRSQSIVHLDTDWQNEIELVHSALYTAPEDESAWQYHRWLWDKVRLEPSVVEAAWEKGNLWLRWSRPVTALSNEINLNSEETLSGEWQWPLGHFSTEWRFESKNNSIKVEQITASFQAKGSKPFDLHLSTELTNYSQWLLKRSRRYFALQKEWQIIQELSDMEPDRPLSACAWLHMEMSFLAELQFDWNETIWKERHAFHNQKAKLLLNQLMDVDKKRKNYYQDMKAKLKDFELHSSNDILSVDLNKEAVPFVALPHVPLRFRLE